MASSVRGMVGSIHREVLAGDLSPQRARELLNRLAALTGNVLEEIRQADAAYAVTLLAHLETIKAANRARIVAETTEEFKRRQEARNTEKVVMEMSRSLKYYLRSLSEEMQIAGQQR